MIKRFANLAVSYAVIAMIFGVFYREFTKFSHFSGQNVTGLGFLLRGLVQVWGTELSRGMDAAISGIAGIGHILTGVCIILLLLKMRKRAA